MYMTSGHLADSLFMPLACKKYDKPPDRQAPPQCRLTYKTCISVGWLILLLQ